MAAHELFLNEQKNKFVGSADREKVASLYRDFAEKVVDLEWEALPFTVDAATQAAVAEAVAACSAKAATVGVSTLEFEGFGASFIKSCKCSPDGFVQVRK